MLEKKLQTECQIESTRMNLQKKTTIYLKNNTKIERKMKKIALTQ